MSAAENKAVFLSYASQDAEAVERIAAALRTAGVEVWFDKNELTGGDSWDQKIRGQIKSCALFVPVISAATNARREGYFRREWKIAVDRTHDMDEALPFLLPVVIDATTDAGAFVPEKFREVQWTRLPGGETPASFCARVKKLLGGSAIDVGPVADRAAVGASLDDARERGRATPLQKSSRPWLVPVALGAAVLIVFAVWASSRKSVADQPASLSPRPTASKTEAPASPIREWVARARTLYEPWDLATLEDLKQAEGLLARALQLDPSDVEALATQALLSCCMYVIPHDASPERLRDARNRADMALKLAPQSDYAQFAYAFALRLAPETEAEAIRRLRELVKRNPENKLMLRILGAPLSRRSATRDEGLELLARAAALPGGDAQAEYVRGETLARYTTRYAEAIAAFDRAIALVPLYPDAHKEKIETLLNRMGRLDAARRALEEVPTTLLHDDRVILVAFEVAMASNDPNGALRVLANASPEMSLDLFTGPSGYLKGLAHRRAGRLSAAEIEWRGALNQTLKRLAATPADSFDLLWKAVLYGLLGDRANAVAAQELYLQFSATQRVASERTLLNDFVANILGSPDEVIARLKARLLDASREQRRVTSAAILFDPALDACRNHPEFPRLLESARAEFGAQKELSDANAKVETTSDPAKATDKSVAVLAFADLSAAHDSEYFSDGISEELLNVLAKVPGLKVTARTSAFHFKGKDTPITEIGRQLGVAYVIEGSVRKSGTKVRITAQLIKAADGFHVWSENFDRELKDIFAVQDEIAGLIAKNFQLKLGAGAVASSGTASLEALQLYLDGRRAWNLRSSAGYAEAEQLLERALVIDPQFARAHAALADVWNMQNFRGENDDNYRSRNSPLITRILAKIKLALSLDPNCAEAYASQGNLLGATWQFEEATSALRRAVALNPNYASAHQWLGRALARLGEMDEALGELRRAAELDPLSHRILDNLAGQLESAGRYGEAWEVIERARALNPTSTQIACFRTRLLLQRGDLKGALVEARRLLTPELAADDPDLARFTAIAVLVANGLRPEAEALLPQFSPESDGRANALVYLGRPREALLLLDRLSVGTLDAVLFGTVLREFDAVRSDPIFQAWLVKVGLKEANDRAQAWRKAHPPEISAVK